MKLGNNLVLTFFFLFFLNKLSLGQDYFHRTDTLNFISFYTVVEGVFERMDNNDVLRFADVTEYYNSGKIKGRYQVKEGNKKFGLHFSYLESGQIAQVDEYFMDKRVNRSLKFYSGGQLASINQYMSIKEDSSFVQVCDSTTHVDSLTGEEFKIFSCRIKSLKDGEWIYFDEKGDLIRIEIFQNDSLIETKR